MAGGPYSGYSRAKARAVLKNAGITNLPALLIKRLVDGRVKQSAVLGYAGIVNLIKSVVARPMPGATAVYHDKPQADSDEGALARMYQGEMTLDRAKEDGDDERGVGEEVSSSSMMDRFRAASARRDQTQKKPGAAAPATASAPRRDARNREPPSARAAPPGGPRGAPASDELPEDNIGAGDEISAMVERMSLDTPAAGPAVTAETLRAAHSTRGDGDEDDVGGSAHDDAMAAAFWENQTASD